jgi:hypothetical protein
LEWVRIPLPVPRLLAVPGPQRVVTETEYAAPPQPAVQVALAQQPAPFAAAPVMAAAAFPVATQPALAAASFSPPLAMTAGIQQVPMPAAVALAPQQAMVPAQVPLAAPAVWGQYALTPAIQAAAPAQQLALVAAPPQQMALVNTAAAPALPAAVALQGAPAAVAVQAAPAACAPGRGAVSKATVDELNKQLQAVQKLLDEQQEAQRGVTLPPSRK